MKQLILKELRERYSAALLGMALFSALLFMAYFSYSGDLNHTAWSSRYLAADALQPMMKSELLVQSCFF